MNNTDYYKDNKRQSDRVVFLHIFALSKETNKQQPAKKRSFCDVLQKVFVIFVTNTTNTESVWLNSR